MLKKDLNSIALASPSASLPGLGSARRLIVLVPGSDADLTAVTHRVWELASATEADVLFIGLYTDSAQEASLRRKLITMSAMVNYDKVSAGSEVIFGRDWVGAVRSHWQAGDTVVCFEEQRVGLSRRPLSQILQSDLNLPLYILSGLYNKNESRPNWPSRVAAWLGSIAIILIFFLFQVQIGGFPKDGTRIELMLFSIPIELWLIWVWNSLFG